MARGGFQAPGTRINKSESERSELIADLVGCIAIGLALDVFVFAGLLLIVLLGWLSIVPILSAVAILSAFLIMWFFGIPKYFTFSVRKPTFKALFRPRLWRRYTFASSKPITAKMIFLACLVAGLVFGKPTWDFLTGNGALRTLAIEFFYPIKFIPYWIASCFLVVVFVVKKRPWSGVAIWAVGSFTTFMVNALLSDAAAQAWAVFAPMARYLNIPFLLPWFPVILLFVIVTTKNRLFPYLDFNLTPLKMSEVREIGLLGLWLPKLVGGKPKEPLPDSYININVEDRGGKSRKYGRIARTKELTAFCQAVLAGGSFTVRTAKRCHYSRTKFEKLRDQFIARQWAVWADPEHPTQGVELLQVGRWILEDIITEQKALPHPGAN